MLTEYSDTSKVGRYMVVSVDVASIFGGFTNPFVSVFDDYDAAYKFSLNAVKDRSRRAFITKVESELKSAVQVVKVLPNPNVAA